MSYSATYVDEKGRSHTITIRDDESQEALRNDYQALMKKYDPKYVTIERCQAEAGEELHLRITVKAPSHYLTSKEDRIPKPCSSMSAEVVAYLGYPLKAVKAFYAPNHYLASPNVFRFGGACIDNWVIFTSSLLTVAEKLIMDMIHNPVVTRYDSMANPYMEEWHRAHVASGAFPSIAPKLVYAPDTPLPQRRSRAVETPTSRPLPRRRDY
ncbi:MAG: hypothetical protein ACLU6B_09185 [Lachnospirales bacterium]